MSTEESISAMTTECCECHKPFEDGDIKYAFLFGLFAECQKCHEESESEEE